MNNVALSLLKKAGFENFTLIQKMAIPVIISGRDAVVKAETGSGKTLSFAIPLVMAVDKFCRDLQALVVVPTRELALQIAEEISKLDNSLGILKVYGGIRISHQVDRLERGGVRVVVGTPGRILDLAARGSLDLSRIRFLVVDEVDRMFDMGFVESVDRILSFTPSDRQTVFLSATVSQKVLDFVVRRLNRDYEVVKLDDRFYPPRTIENRFYRVSSKGRFDFLVKVISENLDKKILVFMDTIEETEKIADKLRKAGLGVKALHGKFSQFKRELVFSGFRNGKFNVLVATDVASRGLDINDVDVVVNYRLPRNKILYIHRVGRTGRAFRKGLAITLIDEKEIGKFKTTFKKEGYKILNAKS
ncbi:MAG: DEAD/DEAH box helicase [Thermosulfidibacteraceae bacterium]|jgi:ATP-dependent RNA helicase DeaD